MAVTKASNSSILNKSPKYVSLLAGNEFFMPSAFESIATATGTGSSGTITFTSIPSTYQHLQLRVIVRDTSTSFGGTSMNLRLGNGTIDAGSNYARHYMYANGSTVSATGNTATSNINLASTVADGGSPANIVGACIIDIHDYASTTKYKTVRSFGGIDFNSTSAGSLALHSGLWMSTSAVNTLRIYISGFSFTTQSVFALYGIKGA